MSVALAMAAPTGAAPATLTNGTGDSRPNRSRV